MSPKACIGTKRGRNYGLVYAPDGSIIGRVFRDGKTAREGLGGGRRSFWTALAGLDGIESRVSLGTRHLRRRDAVNAILAFHRSYPRWMIVREATRYRSHRVSVAPQEWRSCFRCALAALSQEFKYDHWQLCGLSQRNLPNPRSPRATRLFIGARQGS